MIDVSVVDNPDEHRFEIRVGGQLGGFATYRLRDGAVVITHTEIDPAHRGEGLGQELARQTLDQLSSRSVPVVLVCPFFTAYVKKHPESQV